MKHKFFILISLILLLDIRKSSAAFLNLGAGELVLIFINCLFFAVLLASFILLCLYLNKKAKTKDEG